MNNKRCRDRPPSRINQIQGVATLSQVPDRAVTSWPPKILREYSCGALIRKDEIRHLCPEMDTSDGNESPDGTVAKGGESRVVPKGGPCRRRPDHRGSH